MKKRALKLCAAALLILLVIYTLIGNPIIFCHNRALEHSLCSLEDETIVTLNEAVPSIPTPANQRWNASSASAALPSGRR